MEFKGTFKLKNLNKEAGKGISTKFRTRVKIIYLTSCAAYIAAIARQVPVLTGAARASLIWRVKELLDAAVAIDSKIAAELGVMTSIRSIPMTMTDKKTQPHITPKGSGDDEDRLAWKEWLNKQGQNENSWMSDAYVPLIIDVGVGKTYSGKYRVFFEIKDFYLANYDDNSIDSSPWADQFDEYLKDRYHKEKVSVPPYRVGAWNLHMDGRKAFNEMFSRLMKRSGLVLGKEVRQMIDIVGTITKEDKPQTMFNWSAPEMETLSVGLEDLKLPASFGVNDEGWAF